MHLRDTFTMAMHNLWQRRGRTLLNLTGIVVGCVVLLLTMAAVSGIKDALQVLFDSSEAARQIGVLPGVRTSGDPPAEAIAVEGEMTNERRERIERQLTYKWRNENRISNAKAFAPEQLDEFRQLPSVVSVVPGIGVPCRIELPNAPEFASGISGVDVDSRVVQARLLTGSMPAWGDQNLQEVLTSQTAVDCLVDEYLAYQLGFQSDAELQSLVGQTFVLSYEVAATKTTSLKSLVVRYASQLPMHDTVNAAAAWMALRKLSSELDKTALSSEEKTLLRQLIGPDAPKPPGAEKPNGAPNSKPPERFSLVARVAGVVQDGNADGLTSLFRGSSLGAQSGVLLPYQLAVQIHAQVTPEPEYLNGLVTVVSTADLQPVSESLESGGARVLSAMRILETLQERVDESGWAVAGIAAAILLTAAIGISNTLFLSVLERTPEFGILKSLGATDSNLLALLVCEGAILGALGAILSIAASRLIGLAGHGLLVAYVESRLNTDIATQLFQFTWMPSVLVFVLSVFICMVASLLPAWRAAKLDPVIAMRRT